MGNTSAITCQQGHTAEEIDLWLQSDWSSVRSNNCQITHEEEGEVWGLHFPFNPRGKKSGNCQPPPAPQSLGQTQILATLLERRFLARNFGASAHAYFQWRGPETSQSMYHAFSICSVAICKKFCWGWATGQVAWSCLPKLEPGRAWRGEGKWAWREPSEHNKVLLYNWGCTDHLGHRRLQVQFYLL